MFRLTRQLRCIDQLRGMPSNTPMHCGTDTLHVWAHVRRWCVANNMRLYTPTYIELGTQVPVLLIADRFDRAGVDGPGAVLCGQGECILCYYCLSGGGMCSHKHTVALLKMNNGLFLECVQSEGILHGHHEKNNKIQSWK